MDVPFLLKVTKLSNLNLDNLVFFSLGLFPNVILLIVCIKG